MEKLGRMRKWGFINHPVKAATDKWLVLLLLVGIARNGDVLSMVIKNTMLEISTKAIEIEHHRNYATAKCPGVTERAPHYLQLQREL